MLVDRPVDVAPDPSDLDVGLVDEPAIPGQVPDRPGRVDQQGCEPLHPPIEGDVVDLDATLGERLFEVPVGQPVRRYQRTANKITSGGKRKPVNPEGILTGGTGRRVRFIEPPSPPRCDPSTQQSHPEGQVFCVSSSSTITGWD
jgi:hypothetical protein